MAIQLRRGAYTDLDPTRLLPGEIAVVLSGDPNTESGKAIYVCFATGTISRFTLSEDFESVIEDIETNIAESLSGIESGVEAALNELFARSERDSTLSYGSTSTEVPISLYQLLYIRDIVGSNSGTQTLNLYETYEDTNPDEVVVKKGQVVDVSGYSYFSITNSDSLSYAVTTSYTFYNIKKSKIDNIIRNMITDDSTLPVLEAAYRDGLSDFLNVTASPYAQDNPASDYSYIQIADITSDNDDVSDIMLQLFTSASDSAPTKTIPIEKGQVIDVKDNTKVRVKNHNWSNTKAYVSIARYHTSASANYILSRAHSDAQSQVNAAKEELNPDWEELETVDVEDLSDTPDGFIWDVDNYDDLKIIINGVTSVTGNRNIDLRLTTSGGASEHIGMFANLINQTSKDIKLKATRNTGTATMELTGSIMRSAYPYVDDSSYNRDVAVPSGAITKVELIISGGGGLATGEITLLGRKRG